MVAIALTNTETIYKLQKYNLKFVSGPFKIDYLNPDN